MSPHRGASGKRPGDLLVENWSGKPYGVQFHCDTHGVTVSRNLLQGNWWYIIKKGFLDDTQSGEGHLNRQKEGAKACGMWGKQGQKHQVKLSLEFRELAGNKLR